MARRNAAFNRWVVRTLAREVDDDITRIVELGAGPGVGLREPLSAFPTARVWGSIVLR
jgi:hypothetical protein